MKSKKRVGSRIGCGVVFCASIAAGTSAHANDVLIKYTLAGDENLDGTVNAADFTTLAAHFGNTGSVWGAGDYSFDGVVNALDFNALSGTFTSDSYHSTLYTTATVRFDNHRRDDQKLNIDTSWLPHVLAAQQAQAGVTLNTEALKALAVADRSLLYYSLDQKGWITSGHGAPDVDLSLTPTKNMKTAASFTEREFLQFDNAPLIGYAVSGSGKSKQYVTDNFNLSGNSVQPTTLGSTKPNANRGALSIVGAEAMAEQGADYVDILKHYFGADAQLALGTYKFTPAASAPNFAPALDTLIGGPPPTPPAPPAQAHVKMLSNFEHDDGLLGPAATKHVIQTNVADSAINMIKQGLDSTGADQINITYDKKHAKGSDFTFRALTGGGPDEKGTASGNMLLPAAGELGFMVRTKTPGLSTQILVNDHADGTVEKSAARDIIADGHWHLYSWQINSTHGWKNYVKGKGDNLVSGAFTLNSILVNGSRDATLSLDDLAYEEYPNNTTEKPEHLSYNAISPAVNVNYSAINNIDMTGFASGTMNTSYIGRLAINNSTFLIGGGATTTRIGNAGNGTLVLNNSSSIINSAVDLTGGTLQLGNISAQLNNVILNGGTLASTGASVGTIDTAGAVSVIPESDTGSITIAQGGTISTITGGLADYPVGPGTELSHLDDGAMLLSGGSFGAGGLLLLNTGTLLLSDASAAPQFIELQQPSGLIATVMVPEPALAIGITVASLPLLSRRRRASI